MLLASGGVIIAVLVGLLIFYTPKEKEEVQDTSIGMPAPGYENVPEMVVDEGGASGTSLAGESGDYMEHYPGIINDRTERTRVLFFYADWCPTCRPVDEELSQKATELPGNVTVIRVNYNDDQTDEDEEALAKKYGITYQHTFVVIDENGNEIKKWNGGDLGRIIAETS